MKIIIIKITTAHWEPVMCKDFINMVFSKYKQLWNEEVIYRQSNGELGNVNHFIFYNYEE